MRDLLNTNDSFLIPLPKTGGGTGSTPMTIPKTQFSSRLYLHKVVKLDLRSAHLDLTELRDAYCDINDEGNRSNLPTSLASQLSQYTILNSLPMNEWHEIGTFGGGKVSLTIGQNSRTESNGTDQSGSGSNTNTRNIETASSTLRINGTWMSFEKQKTILDTTTR